MELRSVVESLLTSGVPDEALGVWRPEKRLFGVLRPRTIDPLGRVWRLGVLLIDRDGQLYATGSVTRAIVPKDFNSDKTIAGDKRREIQRAAARGAFRPGDTVNYDWRRLSADEAKALLEPVPLQKYLDERLALLT